MTERMYNFLWLADDFLKLAGLYRSIREKEKAMVAYEKAAEACERTDA